MKKKIISLLILGLSVGIVGCGNKTQIEKVKEKIPKQFEMMNIDKVEVENEDRRCIFNLIIVKHKETGKRFIIYRDYRKGGICPLD